MTISKTNLLPPAAAVLISAGLLIVGLMADDQQAYLFSNLFVAAMLLLALAWLAKEAMSAHQSVLQAVPWPEVLSGLLIILIYLLLAPELGFLLSSLLMIFVVGVGFSPERKGLKYIITAALTAVIVVAVIYGLFNVFLKVQTPGGFF